MGANSKISWTNHTFNCWWGCTKVGGSPACDHCYAETWAKRTGFDIWGDNKPRRYFSDKHWAEPLKWNLDAEKAGERARVFCMSMGDWAEGRPEQVPHLKRLWDLVLDTPWLDWLMLTKRPQLINKLCPLRSQRVWHGVTAENQHWLNIRWEHLKRVDSEIYWLSVEPLFGPMILPPDFLALGRRAWVIVGGESGVHARPMHPDWARSLRDQCVAADVVFHFKQHGEWMPAEVRGTNWESLAGPWPAKTGATHDWGDGYGAVRVGKKAAGNLLDGREWLDVPTLHPLADVARADGGKL